MESGQRTLDNGKDILSIHDSNVNDSIANLSFLLFKVFVGVTEHYRMIILCPRFWVVLMYT